MNDDTTEQVGLHTLMEGVLSEEGPFRKYRGTTSRDYQVKPLSQVENMTRDSRMVVKDLDTVSYCKQRWHTIKSDTRSLPSRTFYWFVKHIEGLGKYIFRLSVEVSFPCAFIVVLEMEMLKRQIQMQTGG